jgi:hypothetical protein
VGYDNAVLPYLNDVAEVEQDILSAGLYEQRAHAQLPGVQEDIPDLANASWVGGRDHWQLLKLARFHLVELSVNCGRPRAADGRSKYRAALETVGTPESVALSTLTVRARG